MRNRLTAPNSGFRDVLTDQMMARTSPSILQGRGFRMVGQLAMLTTTSTAVAESAGYKASVVRLKAGSASGQPEHTVASDLSTTRAHQRGWRRSINILEVRTMRTSRTIRIARMMLRFTALLSLSAVEMVTTTSR